MDCGEILPNLFVGTCPTTSDEIETLQKRGITAVLNLQSDDDFQIHGIDWDGLWASYLARGFEVRRVPITDFDDEDLRDELPEAVRVLTELLQGGHKVFVHCNTGVNRSPSVVICLLHWIEGWELEEAVKQVQGYHPCSPVMEVVLKAARGLEHLADFPILIPFYGNPM